MTMVDPGFRLSEMIRLPVPQRTAARLGALPSSRSWLLVAERLDVIAAGLIARFDGCRAFDVALAEFIAGDIRTAGAEIRANLALEELTACQNRLA